MNNDVCAQTASPGREELYKTRTAHGVFVQLEVSRTTCCRSSGAVVKRTQGTFLYSCGAAAWKGIGAKD